MSWKPIDFQGIISLHHSLVEQLYYHLELQENQIADQIINSVHPYQHAAIPPVLATSNTLKYKLSEATDILSKQIKQITASSERLIDTNDWQVATKVINNALWKYLEMLQEYIRELFQQISQMGVDDWKSEVLAVIDELKAILTKHLEGAEKAIQSLEPLLQKYKYKSQLQEGTPLVSLRQFINLFSPLLERQLSVSIYKTKKYLGFKYQKFLDQYSRVIEAQNKIENSVKQFKNYIIYKKIEPDVKDKIRKIYSLTKLWELNEKGKFFPQRETIRALRTLASVDKVIGNFREYFLKLQGYIYEKGRLIKQEPYLATDPKENSNLQDELSHIKLEIHKIGATIKNFREFLISTDPNPYVRHRLGFPEWVSGPESEEIKQLTRIIYDLETLDLTVENFKQAIDRKLTVTDTKVSDIQDDIKEILHEIGQPLMSQNMLRVRAERLINVLQQLDELSNINSDVVDFVGHVLSRMLRVDWKYHVLFGIAAFHELYATHMGMVGEVEDRQHLNRLNRFKKYIRKIEAWVKQDLTPRHSGEIEGDMNDVKEYLQDFFAQVQRVISMEGTEKDEKNKLISLFLIELLEYRYIFGSFFHHLNEKKFEERMLRKQFLFVDQYFEAVENLLQSWKVTC